MSLKYTLTDEPITGDSTKVTPSLSLHTHSNRLQDLLDSIRSISLTIISLFHNPKKNHEMLLRHMHSIEQMLKEVKLMLKIYLNNYSRLP